MKMILTVLAFSTLFISCKKEAAKTTNGEYTANGSKYSGPCLSIKDVGNGGALGNIDVSIVGDGGNQAVIIYNMPKSSSGTFTMVDGFNNSTTEKLYVLHNIGTSTIISSKNGGTVTKTGSNSFTFICPAYDINTNANYSITGSGTYN